MQQSQARDLAPQIKEFLTEEHLQLILEATPQTILVVDRNRTILYVNKSIEALFGYSREELLGEVIEILVPETFRTHHPEYVENFFKEPQTRPMGKGRDLFGRRKDGSEVPIEIRLNPIETPKGNIFTLASIIDITDRKQSEERFRLVVEAAPSAMIMANQNGLIVLINQKVEHLFGYSRAELMGQPIEILVPKKFHSNHPEHVKNFFKEPQARAMGRGRDLFGRCKDGTEVPVEIGLNPLETPEGVFTLASIIDITARKRDEEELLRSNAELEQFAYIASHDLQEPLRMVANYTELLAEKYKGKLDEKADKYIFYSVDGAKRMQRLVADLLAYSRVGSQGKELIPVMVEKVLANVLNTLSQLIHDTGTLIHAETLPLVLADEEQLHQLFQNLITNAIKFRQAIRPQIHIRATLQNNFWVFSVKDNGIGIKMEYAERIFQMFQRLHTRNQYEGSGIGLTIAKRIVERHRGRIWLESEPEVGTTFFFTLLAVPDRRLNKCMG